VELVTAIYEAGIERRTVDLPIPVDDPYYREGALVERAPHFFEKTASVDDLPGAITVGGSRPTSSRTMDPHANDQGD
jgi:hypothetical protein